MSNRRRPDACPAHVNATYFPTRALRQALEQERAMRHLRQLIQQDENLRRIEVVRRAVARHAAARARLAAQAETPSGGNAEGLTDPALDRGRDGRSRQSA